MMPPLRRFNFLGRVLHWTMALLVLTMLFLGIGMITTVSHTYAALVTIHKSLGILILALVAIRLVNRLINPPPALPADLPPSQLFMAKASHLMLYALMFALPVVVSCPRLSGPSPMIVWTTKGTTNAEQEAQAGRDHREAA